MKNQKNQTSRHYSDKPDYMAILWRQMVSALKIPGRIKLTLDEQIFNVSLFDDMVNLQNDDDNDF